MASTSGLSKCCVSGSIHNHATPMGKFEEIDRRRTYVTLPPNGSKSKTVVYITDIFGVDLPNAQLLADTYAKGGYRVLVPDILDGDALPISLLDTLEPPLDQKRKLTMAEKAANAATTIAQFGPWTIKHREAVTKPIIESFIAAVRADPGVTKVGAVGFCWGGRYAILQAQDNTGVDAAAALHPSMTSNADFEAITKPVTIAVGDRDSVVPKATVDGIIDVLEKKVDLPHEIRIYEGQIHGFAVRGDLSSEADRKAMDDAAQQVLDWFDKYL